MLVELQGSIENHGVSRDPLQILEQDGNRMSPRLASLTEDHSLQRFLCSLLSGESRPFEIARLRCIARVPEIPLGLRPPVIPAIHLIDFKYSRASFASLLLGAMSTTFSRSDFASFGLPA